MKVSDLQQHLGDLARLLESSGAKTVALDLSAICTGLAPFRDQPLKGFADFLTRAEGYYARGEVPLTPTSGTRSTRGAAKTTIPNPPPPDVEALAAEIQRLYESAADPTLTREKIETTTARMTPLKKDDLVHISERLGMVGMKTKTKDKIQEAIRERLIASRGIILRSGLI
ncbi:MAG: hypothetical protein EBV06_02745 [Planctomycetia bacterium]|nr:hypothetical protein [Planctomycetia bacterium]